jgi:predicted glycogen debranching enzyme
MLLQKLEETIRIGGASHRLSVNAYPGTIYPTGYEYLEEFRLDPFPVFRYRAGSVLLEKEVCLLRDENTVIIQYRVIESPELIGFTADILLNYRDFHSLTHERSSLNFAKERKEGVVKFTAAGSSTPFYICSDKADFESTGYWYRDFVYAEEQERGYEYKEDIFSPGQFVSKLKSGDSINIAASTLEISRVNFETLVAKERERVQALVSDVNDEFLRNLLLASDAFLVRRNEGASCIAGYHWFCDWGRDAMISLPGLALIPGRYNEAKLTLETFAKNLRYGLIPNYFSEADGTPQYNSLDATLWFFHAARKYFQYTKDFATVRALYAVLKESVEYLSRGTIFEVKADVDMLLNIGQTNEQLTWMDAKIGDFVVTPRSGKPVEINALWYSALETMSSFAQLLGKKKESDVFANMAERVRTSFDQTFWNPEANCLFDRTVNGKLDASIRPNQIIAVALPKSILSHDKEKAVVEAVQNELLTPFGLRTLSPKDPNYKGLYEGDQKSRDLAYHQGPAWPWLLGRFIKAYIRVADDTNSTRETARSFLEPMRGHLSEAGVGFISELFDGDPPYRARGCIAQAWSVAEVLRAYYEDILGREPRDPFTG